MFHVEVGEDLDGVLFLVDCEELAVSLHRLIQQPSSHSVSPLSVTANFCFICEAARSDSCLVLDAMSRSSMLVAEMVVAEGVFRTYTLQLDS